MKATLKKDIVIPAGTVFYTAPFKTERPGDCHIEAIFGLSNNSYGSINYDAINKEELSEFFDFN